LHDLDHGADAAAGFAGDALDAVPFSLARAMPDRTRSTIIARSNSENTDNRSNIGVVGTVPEGVVEPSRERAKRDQIVGFTR
jgi:hypothetical protein